MSSTKISVRTEVSDGMPLAVVYGRGILASSLVKKLEDQKIKVVTLPHLGDVLSILERPTYIFVFVTDLENQKLIEVQVREAFQSGMRSHSRILIFFSEKTLTLEKKINEIAKEVGVKLVRVELQGWFVTKAVLETVTTKFVRLAFSQQEFERQIIFGETKALSSAVHGNGGVSRLSTKNPEKVLESLEISEKRQKRWRFWRSLGLSPRIVGAMALILLVVGLIFAPFFWIGIQTAMGVGQLLTAKNMILEAKFDQAESKALAAKSRFLAIKGFVAPVVQKVEGYRPLVFVDRYYRFLELLDQSTDVIRETVKLGRIAAQIPQAVVEKNSDADVGALVESLNVSLPLVDEQLGLLQAKTDETLSDGAVAWLGFFGFPQSRLRSYVETLPTTRDQIRTAQKILKVLPEIVGATGEKTYLVVFQNSAELRATGGFVGSYALVHFKNGKLSGYKVFDIYAADGQLRGQVSPPDEILHYLGQPSWFMRDANFSPDFPLTAKRLEWFLEKETNQKVDGVIGLDVGAVQKLLEATGPVNLSDFDDIVGAEDFYHKAQYQAEINFFPGSTKKRDYLGAVAEAILQKLVAESGKSWLELNKSIQNAFTEKNLIVYFDNPTVQLPFSEIGWSGSIRNEFCVSARDNCLMVVESNFGANKANFFVQRDYSVQMVIDKAGGVDVALVMHFQNDSPSEAWPGGRYKNYLRILIPNGSKFNGMSLGDERKATESATLTADIIQSVLEDQFLIFKTGEQLFSEGSPIASSFTSYGVLVELPVGSRREIVFHYKPPYKMNFGKGEFEYLFGFIKQPGVGTPAIDFSIEYPTFLKPTMLQEERSSQKFDLRKPIGLGPLLFPQRLVYNTDLGSDRFLMVRFSK